MLPKKTILMWLAVGWISLMGTQSAIAESKIAYPCDGSDPLVDTQLCVSNADGSDGVQLTNFDLCCDTALIDISWSTTGQIVFTRFTSASEPTWGAFVGSSGGVIAFKIDVDGSNLSVIELDPPLYITHPFDGQAPVVWSPELPVNVASIPPFGQFLIVFMLGAVSALWIARKNSTVVRA